MQQHIKPHNEPSKGTSGNKDKRLDWTRGEAHAYSPEGHHLNLL